MGQGQSIFLTDSFGGVGPPKPPECALARQLFRPVQAVLPAISPRICRRKLSRSNFQVRRTKEIRNDHLRVRRSRYFEACRLVIDDNRKRQKTTATAF